MHRRRMYQSNLHDLYFSLLQSDLSALDKYIINGGTVELRGPDKKSLLTGSIEEDREDVFFRCLELGADVRAADSGGMTAVHWAAYLGNVDYVTALIDHGASLNQLDLEGNTALILAVKEGYLDVAKKLMETGCALNLFNESGCTALHVACKGQNMDSVLLLLGRGADTKIRNREGNTPLFYALENKNLKIVKEILESDSRSSEGKLYSKDLLWAVGKHYFDGIEMLLAYGVDPMSDISSRKPWEEVLKTPSMGRIRKILVSEYGFLTSSGPENELLAFLFEKHLFLSCFRFLQLIFSYGLQLQQTISLIRCKEKCLCRKMISDVQSNSGHPLPVSLKMLCRTRIRACLGLGVVRKVHALPLPGVVSRYLCFTGEFCREESLI